MAGSASVQRSTFARELEPFELYWMEEPCRRGERRRIGRCRPQHQDTLGDRRALHQPRTCCSRCWRPTRSTCFSPTSSMSAASWKARRSRRLPTAAYIPVSFHNPFGPVATAAAVQLDACTTNFCHAGDLLRVRRADAASICSSMRHDPDSGRYEISDRPGLGVGEFRPEVAEQHPFEPDAFLPLFRREWAQRF